MNNKKTFKVAIGGAEVEFAVIRPSLAVNQKAQRVHSRAFREACESGSYVRSGLDKVMRDQMLWDDEKEADYKDTTRRILDGEMKLAKGGIRLSEGREIAVAMAVDRNHIRDLNAKRNELDQHTAESHAENARFNFMVASCTVFSDTGAPYFNSYEDYQNRENDPVAGPAAMAFGQLMYGLDDDQEKKLPENKFLLKYNFINEDLHLINVLGQLVDIKGRLVDKDGNFINQDGQKVDGEGNLLTEEGEYKVEFQPFLDDVGQPICDSQNPVNEPQPAQQPIDETQAAEQPEEAKVEAQ